MIWVCGCKCGLGYLFSIGGCFLCCDPDLQRLRFCRGELLTLTIGFVGSNEDINIELLEFHEDL